VNVEALRLVFWNAVSSIELDATCHLYQIIIAHGKDLHLLYIPRRFQKTMVEGLVC